METLPINESVLADVRFECTMLSTYVERHRKNARQLAEYALELNETEALKIECALEVRDIKKCATDLSMYLGLARVLLDCIKSDLNKIDRALEEFKKEEEKKEKRAQDAIRQQRCRDKKAAQKSASGN